MESKTGYMIFDRLWGDGSQSEWIPLPRTGTAYPRRPKRPPEPEPEIRTPTLVGWRKKNYLGWFA